VLDPVAGNAREQLMAALHEERMRITSSNGRVTFANSLEPPKIQLSLKGLVLGLPEKVFHDLFFEEISIVNLESFLTW